jgi:hypothetical protein
MAISENPVAPDGQRIEPTPGRLSAPADQLISMRRSETNLAERLTVAWSRFIHPLGVHRWRDGYEVDTDRGWVQYRGSRCTVCDDPWEGW